ncbi:MAG TPA: 4Fe-4S binding protein [Bacteroidales bacterium]|jgi:Pyruvate/2-oxoacid:ferredoxin oxidoreductase delta subunit|nr:4Fe-4S binding protein [Bacteroidales bacterium]HPB25216.1 4Fe-4S binding protein [Bacteroidales bacterium]
MSNNISQKSVSRIIPVINTALCKKCKKCVDICTKNAISEINNYSCSKCMKYCISMDVPCVPETYFFDYEKCDACGICIEKCPYNAISWHKVDKAII